MLRVAGVAALGTRNTCQPSSALAKRTFGMQSRCSRKIPCLKMVRAPAPSTYPALCLCAVSWHADLATRGACGADLETNLVVLKRPEAWLKERLGHMLSMGCIKPAAAGGVVATPAGDRHQNSGPVATSVQHRLTTGGSEPTPRAMRYAPAAASEGERCDPLQLPGLPYITE